MPRREWGKTTRLIDQATEILALEHPMTVRQLFYRLVSQGELSNMRGDYQRLSGVMTKARNDGRCDFDWIVDRSRPEYRPNVGSTPLDTAKQFREPTGRIIGVRSRVT